MVKKWIMSAAIGTLIGYMAGELINKLDNMDNEERTYEIAHEIQDRLSVIWKE
ncbi:hypothetical protein PK21_gp04 [Geobacillus phage vB_GthS_PK2.1]|nr:hypothetical protein PK21_gp04 [Geobacillus phage vB_GthS_PK2.1]